MDVTIRSNAENNVDKIQTILEILKKQIDQYTFMEENMHSTAQETRSRRIEKLTMQEKRLSGQFEELKKEIKHYEKKYEKSLKRKVKILKTQLEDDRLKLNILKQRYTELNAQINAVTPNRRRKRKQKGPDKVLRIKTRKSRFKQKNAPVNAKIKIRIKRNERLGRREMLFVNDANSFSNLVQPVAPKPTSTRECKILVQKLTDEQVRKHIREKRIGQKEQKKDPKAARASQPAADNTDVNRHGASSKLMLSLRSLLPTTDDD